MAAYQDIATKEILRDQINFLKKKKIIRFDSDLAKELDYTRGAVSEMLSLTSGKPVTYAFQQKFKDFYSKHLNNMEIVHTIEPILRTESGEIRELKAMVQVLKQTCIELIHANTGKQSALIEAELDQAIKLKIQQ